MAIKREYKSMRGKIVDMELLKKKNELTPAVGNVRVNARGDELGPGGKIIKKREDIVKEHYARVAKDNTQKKTNKTVDASTDEKTADATNVDTTKTTSSPKKTSNTVTKKETIKQPLSAEEKKMLEDDEWVEDKDGNFVQK